MKVHNWLSRALIINTNTSYLTLTVLISEDLTAPVIRVMSPDDK
jgi:hypothetical protein